MKTYQLALGTVRDIAPLIERIARRDPDLARQLRSAAMSVPLNINEGMCSGGKNRGARFTNAMASAKERVACLEVAEAVGYVDEGSIKAPLDQLDRIVASLWNMIHKSWR